MYTGMEILATFVLLFFKILSSVEGSERLFEHQLPFDGYMCSTTDYLGKTRSILQCSEACAKVASCVGFFFNHLNNECSGTPVVYVSPNTCTWTGEDTYFYLDGKLPSCNEKNIISK